MKKKTKKMKNVKRDEYGDPVVSQRYQRNRKQKSRKEYT